MSTHIFANVPSKDKNEGISRLIEHSSPRHDFFLMIGLSVSMATFGILLDSVIILIGSMLIAPMLYVILSVSLGIAVSDEKLIYRSLRALGKSVLISVAVAAIISLFFTDGLTSPGDILQTLTNRSLFFYSVVVAVIAGFAATFSLVKPAMNETLPGVAVSVSLIPPLAAVGIGISRWDWSIISSSLLQFLINVLGIVAVSLIVFSLLEFYNRREVAKMAVKKDEEIVKKESEE